MLHFRKNFVLFCIIFASRLNLAFPQEDEDGNEAPVNEEEIEEEPEEEYEEEEVNRGTTITPGVYSTGDEEVDNYLKRRFHVKQIVSEKLGITNFSRQSLYEQSANALFSYIADRTIDQLPTEPPTPEPIVVIRTRRYKVRRTSSTLRNPFPYIDQPDAEATKKTFEITVPNDLTNNAEGTIEISIPQHLTTDTELDIVNPDDLAPISKLTQEGEGGEAVESIEAAIQQALLLAQKNTGLNISTVIIEEGNKTKTIELDPANLFETVTLPVTLKTKTSLNSTSKSTEPLNIVTTLKTVVSESLKTSKPQVKIKDITEAVIIDVQSTPEEEYVESEEDEVVVKRTRKPLVVPTTTLRPSLTNNPIADMIKSRFQNNGISGFVFERVVNTTKSGAKIATDYLWCAWFDYCPDDKEAQKRAI